MYPYDTKKEMSNIFHTIFDFLKLEKYSQNTNVCELMIDIGIITLVWNIRKLDSFHSKKVKRKKGLILSISS